MKKTHALVITLIALVLFNACKKKTLPEPEEGNNPQFYFSGKVNGSDVRLEAGVNDYYMFSNYSQGTLTGVYGFEASLKPENCTTCSNSIKIQINDCRYSTMNGPSGIDSAFLSTFYPYYNGNAAPVSYYLSFYSLFNNTAQSYIWAFGDGDSSNLPNPSHIYRYSGDYNVTLSVQDNFSCTNSVSNVQKVGLSDSYCNTTISVTGTSSLNASFTNSTVGTPPYNFYWDLGDGNYSNVTSPTHTYAAQGRYPVSLRVIDAVNDTAFANFNYITSGANMCTTNYIVVNSTPVTNPMALSNITVKWTDASGTEFTSNNALQPATSYFKIVSVSDYHTNDAGQKTKKLHIKFKCTVYSSTGSMQIDNGDAVVVVAYK